MYNVTKEFFKGPLKGITLIDTTSVLFEEGKKYNNYIVVKVEKV